MKKLFLIIILLGVLITNKVNASNVLPPVIGFLGWSSKYVCTHSYWPLLFRDYDNAGLVQFATTNFSKSNYNRLILELDGYCISDAVGAIYDFREINGGIVYYCSRGKVVGINPENPSTYVETENYVRLNVCCPTSSQYLYSGDFWQHYKCCSKIGLDKNFIINNDRCSAKEIGVDPENLNYFDVEEQKKIIENDDPNDNVTRYTYIKKAEQRYTCEVNNCFLVNGSAAGASINRSNLTLKDINQNKYECFKNQAADIDIENVGSNSYSSQYNSNMQFYCIAGDVLDKTEIEKYKNKLNPYVACKSYSSEEEQQKCIDCLNQCGEDDNSCVYSSLGCVRTSVDGALTTVMRIGVGILGAVGIFRIMQAAILRQSADPKDIQESWDIIISVIIGAIVLLASTIILRIIGVDILGILPFDF